MSAVRVTLLREPVKLRGMPNQGVDFFKAYYAMFRGRGVILTSSVQGFVGLFSAINSFFAASSVLYLGCEAGGAISGGHIEAAVLSPSVKSMEAVCTESDRPSLKTWAPALTRSLAASTKDPSKFRIELSLTGERDRDLIVHHLDNLFPPAPSKESALALVKFLKDSQAAAKRLQFGGFYVLPTPVGYNGIDILLSSIAVTASVDRPLIYAGMILYSPDIALWVFRLEPMNPATLESQRTMTSARLTRYPPILQSAISEMMPDSTQVSETSFDDILATRVTPTDTLGALFRMVKGPNPREVLNRIGAFQPKYSSVIDTAKSLSNLKVQIRVIVEMLYDLTLAAQRSCAAEQVSSPTTATPPDMTFA